jgi:guanylate kinase
MSNKFENLIIISGPSGAGEDSIIKGLKEVLPLDIVITTTTRDMRENEAQGNPYYFIPNNEFIKLIENDELFEYAQEYNGNFYGVTIKELERVSQSDKIGLWKIEYQGVITAKKKIPNIKAIFINAPLETLETRIRKRENVDEGYVKERMNYTKEWLKYKDIYDYEVINEEGKLDQAIEKVAKIIKEIRVDKI